MRFSFTFDVFRTAFKLGLINIFFVLIYRFRKKFGIYPKAFEGKKPTTLLTFKLKQNSNLSVSKGLKTAELNDLCSFCIFGHLYPFASHPFPNWFLNLSNGSEFSQLTSYWYEIEEFSSDAGDIKTIWELSRMSWAPFLAANFRFEDKDSLDLLNNLLTDWSNKNPFLTGPNWICAQEAGFRVLNLVLAKVISERNTKITENFYYLIQIHLQRINVTSSYAKAQNNNHSITEGAALFLGGMVSATVSGGFSVKMIAKGRKLIEQAASKLIASSGGFSQYSVNYHRLVLETLAVVELLRRSFDAPPFSDQFYSKLKAATTWLFYLTDARTGNVPNIGGNDGAWFLYSPHGNILDYRPAVNLAGAVFLRQKMFTDVTICNYWENLLGFQTCEFPLAECKDLFDEETGFASMTVEDARLIFRFPAFRFRPSHADFLHVDFWLKGRNILRDGGSFSYNCSNEFLDYFTGLNSHNTVKIKGASPMVRLSRFLFGNWPSTKLIKRVNTNEGRKSVSAAYQIPRMYEHKREIHLFAHELVVSDEISIFNKSNTAVISWRLEPAKWKLTKKGLREVVLAPIEKNNPLFTFTTSSEIIGAQIIEGCESLRYLEKDTVPVVQVEFCVPCSFKTHIRFL